MKLALIGYPIDHSLSPSLYKEFLQDKLEGYDLLSYPKPDDVPHVSELAKKYDGINITTPYKKHFLEQVEIPSPLVKELGAINTLSFTSSGVLATNTDALAVEEILKNYQIQYPRLHLLILGKGVMAKITQLTCEALGVSYQILARSPELPDISRLDLRSFRKEDSQNLIINACSRSFVFSGSLDSDDIFWDYNYSFLPHSNSLPSQVKSYEDGQELLRLQAMAAIAFWAKTNPKLKY